MITEVVEEMGDHTGTDAFLATARHHVAETEAETLDYGKGLPNLCPEAEERALPTPRQHHATDRTMLGSEAPARPAKLFPKMLKCVSPRTLPMTTFLTSCIRPLSLQPKLKLRLINKPNVWLN